METNGTTLSPPPFREALSPAQEPLKQPLLMQDTWQRWLQTWWQQHAALWKQGQGGTWQPLDATLTGLAALTGTADTVPYFTGTDVMALTPLSAYSRTLLGSGDAGTWRSTMGLGTMSVQNANAVAITGGNAALGGAGAGLAQLAVQGATNMSDAPGNFAAIRAYPSTNVASTSVMGVRVEPPAVSGAGTMVVYYAVQVMDKVISSSADSHAFWTNFNAGTNKNAISCMGTAPSYFGGTVQVSGRTGLAYPPPANVWLRAGNMATDAIYIGAGDVTPRWGIDCVREASIATLGVGYAPPSGLSIRAGACWLDHVGINETPVGGWYLTTQNLLVRANIQANTLLTLSTAQFNGVCGFGFAPDASVNIRAGITWTDALSVAGGYDNRFGARFYNLIYCDGVPYSAYPGPWQAYSDRRMKMNIYPILHPLETMCRLRGVQYEWRHDDEWTHPQGVQMGVIAQEVEDVLPSWVGELEGYKTTQLSKFEALAIESFKELTARVAALEEQLACP